MNHAKGRTGALGLLRRAARRATRPATRQEGVGTPQAKERPTRTFDSFFRHAKRLGFDPTVCIDVGAGAGTKSIYDAFPNAHHVAFEPLPDFHEALAKSLEGREHEIHHCALMDREGSLDILRTEHNLFGSSLMHRRDEGDPRLVKVPVRRLDDVMAGRDLRGHVLLKTDCQGSDLLVIKGGGETLRQCDLVIMEVSFFRFWGDHHPDFFDIVSYMNL